MVVTMAVTKVGKLEEQKVALLVKLMVAQKAAWLAARKVVLMAVSTATLRVALTVRHSAV